VPVLRSKTFKSDSVFEIETDDEFSDFVIQSCFTNSCDNTSLGYLSKEDERLIRLL
jgi:hypothetical protein